MDRDLLKELNAVYGDRPDFQIMLRDLLKKEHKKDNTLWLTFKEGGKTQWVKI